MMTETAKRLRQMSLRTSNRFPGCNRSAAYSDEWYTPPRIVQALRGGEAVPCLRMLEL